MSEERPSAGTHSRGTGFDRRALPQDAVETRWRAGDGHSIRRIDWLRPKGTFRGSLLFVAGRGDAYEKYLETLDYWSCAGWRVTSIDWRGQAGSGRLGFDPVTGHVDDFSTWVDDLATFWNEFRQRTPGPHVLVGHSMGGHLALRAMAEKRVKPDAAVLSAPMLGFHPAFVPVVVLHWMAKLMVMLGDPRRPAWKWGEKPGKPPAHRINLLTHDEDRYEDELWWRSTRPELVMGPASWGWMERALASMRVLRRPGMLEHIGLPVLILATRTDRLVDFGAIERAAKRMPRAQLVRFGSEARHEILREGDVVREKALTAIDEFLDRMAPVVD